MSLFGGLAQLARASGSYPAGRWFKSDIRYQTRPVGQAVKTRPFHGCNMGSIPVRVTKPEKALQEECFFHFRVWRPVHSPNPLARHHICKFARFFRRKGFAYLAAQRSRYCGSAEIYEKGQYIKWAMQYALPRAPHSRTLPPWRPRRARQIPVLAPRTAFRTCPALGIIFAHSPRISSPMKFL